MLALLVSAYRNQNSSLRRRDSMHLKKPKRGIRDRALYSTRWLVEGSYYGVENAKETFSSGDSPFAPSLLPEKSSIRDVRGPSCSPF